MRYGSWPLNLHALTPEFLPALPRDLMNGDALCYLLNWDGGFTVYSVGQDGRDDAGDPATWSFRQPARDWSPWDGRDWMWPRGVAPKDAGGQANQSTDQPEHHAGQAPRSQLQKSFSATVKKRIIILVGGVVLVMVCLLAVVALGRRASNEVILSYVGRSEMHGFRLVHFELLVPSDRRVFVIPKFARRRALVEVGGTQTFTGQPPQFHTDPSGKDLAPDTRVGFSIVEPDLSPQNG